MLDQIERRRKRLAQLLDLAQNYKSWTRKDLAKTLGRDPTKLIPGSGIPKLDLVVDLAGVLDWAVGDVVAYLWGGHSSGKTPTGDEDFEAIDAAARDAHREGKYALMVELARKAFHVASAPDEKARACNREAGGWDGLGRYSQVLDAVQRGLQQTSVTPEYHRMLQSNLANAYYTLWSMVEARAISGDLISFYQHRPPETLRDRKTQAFAHYVSGHTCRRLMSQEPDRIAEFAARAKSDLTFAQSRYTELAAELNDDSFAGIANTCRGGLIEVAVELDEYTPQDALDELAAGLENVLETEHAPLGDRLESYGWWCIFGCNLALRHLASERELQSHMAIFTNKADEIANRLDNWSMRERVFVMEHARWERAVGCTGFDIPRVVDEEDVRVITGTMARFPTFRETGWRILRSARVVRAN